MKESDGGASTEVLVLHQEWLVCLSTGDTVTALLRMLVAGPLCSGTAISLDRQSTALLQAPDIHLNVILYVPNSSVQQFTMLLAFLPLRNFCRGL